MESRPKTHFRNRFLEAGWHFSFGPVCGPQGNTWENLIANENYIRFRVRIKVRVRYPWSQG